MDEWGWAAPRSRSDRWIEWMNGRPTDRPLNESIDRAAVVHSRQIFDNRNTAYLFLRRKENSKSNKQT
jgi:hypothetical protein